MGNYLCPRKKCQACSFHNKNKIKREQFIVYHGIGETKLYKITLGSIPSPYARPVLIMPDTPARPKIYIGVPKVIEIAKWNALAENIDNLHEFKENIIKSIISNTNTYADLFIGSSTWYRNADIFTKQKVDQYLQDMKIKSKKFGIHTTDACLSGEEEAMYEATAVCFASEIIGIPTPSIIVSSRGESFNLWLKNPIKGWVSTSYNIGFLEGIDILNKPGENHVKVSDLRNKTKLTISGMSNFITENLPQFDNSRQLRVVATSASY